MSETPTGGVVFQSQPSTDRQSLAFPRIAVLPSGRWLATCRASAAKQDEVRQHTLIRWSDDQGKTWSASIRPFAPQTVNGHTGSIRCATFTPLGGNRVLATMNWQDTSDPKLPLFNPETEGVIDLRIFTSISEDGGQTWSAPQRVVEKPYDKIPVSITGPILLLKDGTWMAQFELNKTYHDAGPWHQAAVAMHSADQGKTWTPAVDVARDPKLNTLYWDQRPQVMGDGSVISMMWTFDKSKGEYLNIHAVRSTDGGRTWSEPWDTGVPGQPAAPVQLGGNRIALVYVDRTAEPTIKLRLSRDGGRTFPNDTEHTIHQRSIRSQTVRKGTGASTDAWSEMGAFSIGLPDAVRLSDDDLLVVYYTGPDKDHTDVEWARVKVG